MPGGAHRGHGRRSCVGDSEGSRSRLRGAGPAVDDRRAPMAVRWMKASRWIAPRCTLVVSVLLGTAFGAGAQSASSTPQFSCSFASAPTDCGFAEQAYPLPRATIINAVARGGPTALRLHTEPGDSNVAGSGNAGRDHLVRAAL